MKGSKKEEFLGSLEARVGWLLNFPVNLLEFGGKLFFNYLAFSFLTRDK